MIESERGAGFIDFMQEKASGKNVLLLFVVTMAVYLLMLSVTIPRVQSYAPETALFDLSPAGYTHAQALSLLESLGRAGRDAYLFPQLALDFVYPGLFATCFSLMLIWLYSKRIRPNSKWLYLAVIPVLGRKHTNHSNDHDFSRCNQRIGFCSQRLHFVEERFLHSVLFVAHSRVCLSLEEAPKDESAA
jgi:hypothetical protein